MLKRRKRRLTTMNSFAEVPWLQPYPDELLDEIASPEQEPDTLVVERETIALAFLAAMQLLPPRQRAALIVRDLLGWSAAETASLLETSVPAANSALQRARETLKQNLPEERSDWSATQPTAEEQALLERFIEANDSGDARAALEICSQDIRVTMPPHPFIFEGLDAIVPLMARAIGPDGMGDWRLVPTGANRMPTAASYLRRNGDTEFRAFKFDVLRIEDGLIAEITTFDADMFPAFGLPPDARERRVAWTRRSSRAPIAAASSPTTAARCAARVGTRSTSRARATSR